MTETKEDFSSKLEQSSTMSNPLKDKPRGVLFTKCPYCRYPQETAERCVNCGYSMTDERIERP